MPKKTPQKKPVKQSPPPTPPLLVQVAGSNTVLGILTRTKGLLELIEVACESASDDYGEVTDVFGPDLLRSLPQLCRFAASDLDLVEMYLSHDAVDFHKNQLSEMEIDGPGAAE